MKYGYMRDLRALFLRHGRKIAILTAKFKKGDLVMVEENGRSTKYEILSVLSFKKKRDSSLCYEAKSTASGENKIIVEEDILRIATPVDSSAELFPK